MGLIGRLTILLLLLCSPCICFSDPSGPCTSGVRPQCTFFVCNLGASCPNSTIPSWFTSFGAAFQAAALASTNTSDLSFIATPGVYYEGVLDAFFEYGTIFISPTPQSTLNTANEQQEALGSALLTPSPILIYGGFFDEHITSPCKWTFTNVHIFKSEDSSARCLDFKSDSNFSLVLRHSAVLCRLSLTVHEEYASYLELTDSQISGSRTVLQLGDNAAVVLTRSTLGGSRNDWVLSRGNAKLFLDSSTVTALSISSFQHPLSITVRNCTILSLIYIQSLALYPDETVSAVNFRSEANLLMGGLILDVGPKSSFYASQSTFYDKVHVDMEHDSTVELTNSVLAAESKWQLGERCRLTCTGSQLSDSHYFNSTADSFNATFANSTMYRVNVTSQDYLNLTVTGSTTIRGFSVKSRHYHDITLLENDFGGFVILMSHQLRARIERNFFTGQKRIHPRNQLSAGNLVMLPDCIADLELISNVFRNGTAFLAMLADSIACKHNFSVRSSIHHNRFPIQPRRYSLGDVLKEPSVPALGYFPVTNTVYFLDTFFGRTLLNATHNWWGSPSGPYLCCNPKGEGAYTTNKVDASRWCLTPNCESFSNVAVPSTCIQTGCVQRFTTVQRLSFFISFGAGTVILLSGILLLLWRDRQVASISALDSSSDVADRCHRSLYIGLAFSTIGTLASVVNVTPLLYSTLGAGFRAHQQRVPYRNMLILFLFAVMAGLQVLLNLILALSLRAHRRTHSRVFLWLLGPAYLWNIVTLCSTVTLSIWWIPYSGYADLFDPYFLTMNAPLSSLVYLPSVLITLMSLCTLVPLHWVLFRVKYYGYSKLNATIDQELVEMIRHEPELERMAHVLRMWIAASFIAGIVSVTMTIYGLVTDPYTTPRYLTSMFEIVMAFTTLLLTVRLTFAYDRLTLLMIATVVLLLLLMGTLQDAFFWAIYIAIGEQSLSRDILHLITTILWSISLAIPTFLLYRLGDATLERLPTALASNLNKHLDHAWGSGPSVGLSFSQKISSNSNQNHMNINQHKSKKQNGAQFVAMSLQEMRLELDEDDDHDQDGEPEVSDAGSSLEQESESL